MSDPCRPRSVRRRCPLLKALSRCPTENWSSCSYTQIWICSCLKRYTHISPVPVHRGICICLAGTKDPRPLMASWRAGRDTRSFSAAAIHYGFEIPGSICSRNPNFISAKSRSLLCIYRSKCVRSISPLNPVPAPYLVAVSWSLVGNASVLFKAAVCSAPSPAQQANSLPTCECSPLLLCY